MRLLLTWLINAGALMALPYLLSSVTITHFGAALVAALVLGLVNTLIRPILLVLTLPVTVLSLGLFILVINAFLLWLTDKLMSRLEITSWASLFFGAILLSLIDFGFQMLLRHGTLF